MCRLYLCYLVRSRPIPGIGCSVSWTRAGQNCYYMGTNPKKSWTDAQTACAQRGSSIIKVDTADKKVRISL